MQVICEYTTDEEIKKRSHCRGLGAQLPSAEVVGAQASVWRGFEGRSSSRCSGSGGRSSPGRMDARLSSGLPLPREMQDFNFVCCIER